MYPDFRYLLEAIFGIPMPEWVGIFKTFGFFVALAFLAAAYTLTLELKRKERLGLIQANFKIDKKTGKSILVHPYERVGEILMLAAIGGLVGAKIFNALETWDNFIHDPIGNLFSTSGLTFYGGLIVAATAIYFYAKKNNIPFSHLCDAAAPGLMLAYGLGRFGCHFAGDGDWGIANSAYASDQLGNLSLVAQDKFQSVMQATPGFFINEYGSIDKVQHMYAPAPSWMPQWIYAFNYPHNVNNQGMRIADCAKDYCAVLPVGVFPTPLYEAITCILLFTLLWAIRRKIYSPFRLFGIYLILNGLERFFVEKIRVNTKYNMGFIHPTQAEIISTVLIILGIVLLIGIGRKKTEFPVEA